MSAKRSLKPIVLTNAADVRAEFEGWAAQHFKDLDFTFDGQRGRYWDSRTNWMWFGYAGRAGEGRAG